MISSPPVLPDVNLLLAFGWRSHSDHERCRSWLSGLPRFATCPITELGFLRVSMSPAYRASHEDASRVLGSLISRQSASFLPCDLPVPGIAPVSAYQETTGCYLVELARKHSMKLATLDEGILKAAWSRGIAFHPFRAR
jgi:predicted nucleic acid-binding protein